MAGQIPVRTIPPYVRSVEWDDADTILPESNSESDHSPKLIPIHIPGFRRTSAPGRKFDHLRDREPPIITTPILEYGARWVSFASPETGGPPRRRITDSEAAQAREILVEYDRQQVGSENEAGKKEGSRESRSCMERTKRFIYKNPFMPLIFRLLVLTFSATALALGGSIFQHLHSDVNCVKGASTYMAIIVDVIAIIYILYITVDEYHSPPIGIRPSSAKLRLTLLDLLFIVFAAANLSLALQAVNDPQWICHNGSTCGVKDHVCQDQKALASVLLIALIAWLSTFIVTLVRLVSRVVYE